MKFTVKCNICKEILMRIEKESLSEVEQEEIKASVKCNKETEEEQNVIIE